MNNEKPPVIEKRPHEVAGTFDPVWTNLKPSQEVLPSYELRDIEWLKEPMRGHVLGFRMTIHSVTPDVLRRRMSKRIYSRQKRREMVLLACASCGAGGADDTLRLLRSVNAEQRLLAAAPYMMTEPDYRGREQWPRQSIELLDEIYREIGFR